MPARSVGTLLVQSSLGVCRYLENVDEVIVHVFLFVASKQFIDIITANSNLDYEIL